MIDPRHTECADIKNVRHVQWNEVRSNDWERQTILLAQTDLAILNPNPNEQKRRVRIKKHYMTSTRFCHKEVYHIAQVYCHDPNNMALPGAPGDPWSAATIKNIANGIRISAFSLILICLYKVAHQMTFIEMTSLFGRDAGTISKIFNYGMHWFTRGIYARLAQRTHMWPRNRAYLVQCIQALQALGCPLTDCACFIDGFWQDIGKPSREPNPGDWYNGYYGGHGLLHYLVAGPDGLIWACFVGAKGANNDLGTLASSGLVNWLRHGFTYEDGLGAVDANGNFDFHIGGDGIYGLAHYPVIGCYTHRQGWRHLSVAKRAWNLRFSRCRILIEHQVGIVTSSFRVTRTQQMNFIKKSDVEAQVFLGIILSNLRVLLRGYSKTSVRFNVHVRTYESVFPEFAGPGPCKWC